MDYLIKIAEDLGISRSSVYRAIKHMKPMSAEMRKKVIDYISEHYPEKLEQVNYSAEEPGVKNIVVITPYKPEYFWTGAASGMEAAKRAFPDCPVELKYLFYSGPMTEGELIYILGSADVNAADALCVVPVDSESVAEKINAISESKPVAVFNQCCPGSTAFLNVVTDGYAEGKAVGEMVRKQCRPGTHVLMIVTETYRSNIFEGRIRGFCETLNGTGDNYIIDTVDITGNDRYNYHTFLPALMAREVNEYISKVESNGEAVSGAYIINGLLLPLFVAFRKIGRHDISVFGHEINDSALEFYRAGMRGGYVRQDIFMQGYAVIRGLVEKLYNDKTIYPEMYNIPFDIGSYPGNADFADEIKNQ